NDPRFARDVAERTGYVPKGLMAVPLLHDERALGVLQVLDRPSKSRFSLEEMELLGLFGTQAAVALDLLRAARRAPRPWTGSARRRSWRDSPLPSKGSTRTGATPRRRF